MYAVLSYFHSHMHALQKYEVFIYDFVQYD